MRDNDPLWYKDAIIYEVHVRAFQDSDGDGIGDFRGLTERLGYLQDLGITAIWLLPFYPSPLRDDGYDIADYTDIHGSYGSLHDFDRFLDEAHRRGMRVITELVLNHTSDQHPWFQRARRAPAGSTERDFYVWSGAPTLGDRPTRYQEARIIFQDYEQSNWSWDSVAQAYYWHRFFSHQPDLNYDNPAVREAILPVLDFWLDRGVDGLRLDAVPYLFEREGTSCENLPETYAFLSQLRSHVDARFHGRMLLAEANQWPEDAARYFGAGDICHMAFHFPLMPRLFMAVHMEDRFPILDILAQTPAIPEACQWALFLRNHDELTLEMVTDEERDFMNRTYAGDPNARLNQGIRRRLAPLLRNNRRRIELMNALLLSLPGTPVIYYGDEIGMGDNIYLGDRDGVRTPMQWSSDRNAGFSRSNPQQLYLPVIIDPEYHYASVNVEAQQENPHTLLSWMKRLIALRKRFRALGRGSIEFLHPANIKVLAFLRAYGDERVLVVANLSRFVQYVALDLPDDRGMVPVEVFGRSAFPPIGDDPYVLTLGPHAFYWFSLEPETAAAGEPRDTPRTIAVRESGEELLGAASRAAFEPALRDYITRRQPDTDRREIRYIDLLDAIPLETDRPGAFLTFLAVEPAEGEPSLHFLPVAFAPGEQAAAIRADAPDSVIARLTGGVEGVACDATADPAFFRALLGAVTSRRTLRGGSGVFEATDTDALDPPRRAIPPDVVPTILRRGRDHCTVSYGDALVLKLFHRVDEAINPDLEIGRFLTERGFAHTPPVAGALEYRRDRQPPATVGIFRGYVADAGDGWVYTRRALAEYFVRVRRDPEGREPSASPHLLALDESPPPRSRERIGPYLDFARALGRRTADLHRALASELDDPAFAPIALTSLYQRSLYQSMRARLGRTVRSLRRHLDELAPADRDAAAALLGREPEILARFGTMLDEKIAALRTRCHGDYHLGQVIVTGGGTDVLIHHFAGDLARPLGERRLKRSPLRDVVAMLASFEIAAGLSLVAPPEDGEEAALLRPWAPYWSACVGQEFLRAYIEASAGAGFIPDDRRHLRILLDTFLLERWIEHLGRDLIAQPPRAGIAIRAVLHHLASRA